MVNLGFVGVEMLARKIGSPGTFIVVGPTDRAGRIAIVARRDDVVIKAKIDPPKPNEAARRAFIAALIRTGADVVETEDQARLLRSARRAFRMAKSATRLHTRRAAS